MISSSVGSVTVLEAVETKALVMVLEEAADVTAKELEEAADVTSKELEDSPSIVVGVSTVLTDSMVDDTTLEDDTLVVDDTEMLDDTVDVEVDVLAVSFRVALLMVTDISVAIVDDIILIDDVLFKSISLLLESELSEVTKVLSELFVIELPFSVADVGGIVSFSPANATHLACAIHKYIHHEKCSCKISDTHNTHTH